MHICGKKIADYIFRPRANKTAGALGFNLRCNWRENLHYGLCLSMCKKQSKSLNEGSS